MGRPPTCQEPFGSTRTPSGRRHNADTREYSDRLARRATARDHEAALGALGRGVGDRRVARGTPAVPPAFLEMALHGYEAARPRLFSEQRSQGLQRSDPIRFAHEQAEARGAAIWIHDFLGEAK